MISNCVMSLIKLQRMHMNEAVFISEVMNVLDAQPHVKIAICIEIDAHREGSPSADPSFIPNNEGAMLGNTGALNEADNEELLSEL
jgi:hypothetical protein